MQWLKELFCTFFLQCYISELVLHVLMELFVAQFGGVIYLSVPR